MSGSPTAGLAINENWGAKAVIVPADNMFCHAWLVPVVESDEEATVVIQWEACTILLANGTFKPREICLQLPYLVPKPDQIGQKDVRLSRCVSDFDVGNLRGLVRSHQNLITTSTKANSSK